MVKRVKSEIDKECCGTIAGNTFIGAWKGELYRRWCLKRTQK